MGLIAASINDMTRIIAFILVTVSVTCCFRLADAGPNTFIKESSNNQETKKVILFSKEGNATVPNSLQVTISDFAHKLNSTEAGNIFTVDSNYEGAVEKRSLINFTWPANDTLEIEFNKKLRIFIQNNFVNGVRVIYKPV